MSLAITPEPFDLSEIPPLIDLEDLEEEENRWRSNKGTPSPPRADCIVSMIRSLTVDDDYFERRALRTTCTQKHPVDDFLPQYSEIIPGLFVADMYTATSSAVIRDLGITHVVSVVKHGCPHYSRKLQHICVPIEDTSHTDILGHLDSMTQWIQRALASGGQVMVHCVWGMSRSASFVIAFLMAYKRMSLADALKHVVARRRIVKPNSGFMTQLRVYEVLLQAKEARRRRILASARIVRVRK